MVLITASYTMSWTSVHSSSGNSVYQISSFESICHFHCILVRDLIWVIPEWSSGFPYFIQHQSEFGNKEFMNSATATSQSCFFLTVQSCSIFGCKEYNQSDFAVHHLEMSMCKVFQLLCCWKRVFAMTSVFSWQNSVSLCPLLAFILYSEAKLACYSRYYLTSYFCIPVPYDEKNIFFCVSSRRSCRSS